MGDCLLSNFDLANSILINPTLLEISKLSMLEIFLFAVFSTLLAESLRSFLDEEGKRKRVPSSSIPTYLGSSKETLFAGYVFSYCTFKLAIKRIDKSIIIFCILSWFWDYPQRGTQGYRFGFSVVTSLLVVESITRQWNIDKSLIYLLFFREDELDPKSNDKCSSTFRSFLMMN